MSVCYNKLWKLLIDRGMTKTDLIKASGITTNAMAKMGKNEDVRVEVLVRICETLGCSVDEIMELVSQSNKAKNAMKVNERTSNDEKLR